MGYAKKLMRQIPKNVSFSFERVVDEFEEVKTGGGAYKFQIVEICEEPNVYYRIRDISKKAKDVFTGASYEACYVALMKHAEGFKRTLREIS